MNKKYLVILLLLLIVIAGGVLFWFSTRPTPPPLVPSETEQPEEAVDEITNLLNNLKEETGINFSEIKEVEIKWIVEVEPKVEEKTIAGKGFEVKRISSEQAEEVRSFLKNKGFERDLYNMADGTVAGLTGYKRDEFVCTVAEGTTGYKEATGQWIPPEPDKRDVEVKCGGLEETEEEVVD